MQISKVDNSCFVAQRLTIQKQWAHSAVESSPLCPKGKEKKEKKKKKYLKKWIFILKLPFDKIFTVRKLGKFKSSHTSLRVSKGAFRRAHANRKSFHTYEYKLKNVRIVNQKPERVIRIQYFALGPLICIYYTWIFLAPTLIYDPPLISSPERTGRGPPLLRPFFRPDSSTVGRRGGEGWKWLISRQKKNKTEKYYRTFRPPENLTNLRSETKSSAVNLVHVGNFVTLYPRNCSFMQMRCGLKGRRVNL